MELEVEKYKLVEELNAQMTLFMYYINYLFYKEKYEKSLSGSLSSKLFGNEQEINNLKKAANAFREKEQELIKAGYTERNDSRIQVLVGCLFRDDYFYEKRISWALDFVLFFDNSFVNDVLKRGFSAVSTKIHFRPDTLFNILKKYKDNWTKLKVNNNFNRALAIGAGVAAFLTLCCVIPNVVSKMPESLNVTLAKIGGGALKNGGSGMQGGITLLNFILGATSVGVGGIVYKIKTDIDKKILIDDMKKVDSDDFSYQLCYLLTIVEVSFRVNNIMTENSKNIVQLLITMESELKNEFYIKQEGHNEDLNKKIILFRNLFSEFGKYILV